MWNKKQMKVSCFYKSPIGWIETLESEKSLVRLSFVQTISKPQKVSQFQKELDHYFNTGMIDRKIKFIAEGTTFQKEIWEIVKRIPKGKTKTYKQIALTYGNINSIRAVANAIGKNPILLFIPCHRVIGSDGSMTGFAGGIKRKKWLLEHEGASIQKTLDL